MRRSTLLVMAWAVPTVGAAPATGSRRRLKFDWATATLPRAWSTTTVKEFTATPDAFDAMVSSMQATYLDAAAASGILSWNCSHRQHRVITVLIYSTAASFFKSQVDASCFLLHFRCSHLYPRNYRSPPLHSP